VHVRVSEGEGRAIGRAAARRGLTTQAFVRAAALAEAERVLGEVEAAKAREGK